MKASVKLFLIQDENRAQGGSTENNQEKITDDTNEHLLSHGGEDCDMVPYKQTTYSEDEMKKRSQSFYKDINHRRSVRFFSDKDVPIEVIENCIRTAGESAVVYEAIFGFGFYLL